MDNLRSGWKGRNPLWVRLMPSWNPSKPLSEQPLHQPTAPALVRYYLRCTCCAGERAMWPPVYAHHHSSRCRPITKPLVPLVWTYEMRREMQEILPGLFLGPYSAASKSQVSSSTGAGTSAGDQWAVQSCSAGWGSVYFCFPSCDYELSIALVFQLLCFNVNMCVECIT